MRILSSVLVLGLLLIRVPSLLASEGLGLGELASPSYDPAAYCGLAYHHAAEEMADVREYRHGENILAALTVSPLLFGVVYQEVAIVNVAGAVTLLPALGMEAFILLKKSRAKRLHEMGSVLVDASMGDGAAIANLYQKLRKQKGFDPNIRYANFIQIVRNKVESFCHHKENGGWSAKLLSRSKFYQILSDSTSVLRQEPEVPELKGKLEVVPSVGWCADSYWDTLMGMDHRKHLFHFSKPNEAQPDLKRTVFFRGVQAAVLAQNATVLLGSTAIGFGVIAPAFLATLESARMIHYGKRYRSYRDAVGILIGAQSVGLSDAEFDSRLGSIKVEYPKLFTNYHQQKKQAEKLFQRQLEITRDSRKTFRDFYESLRQDPQFDRNTSEAELAEALSDGFNTGLFCRINEKVWDLQDIRAWVRSNFSY